MFVIVLTKVHAFGVTDQGQFHILKTGKLMFMATQMFWG